MKSLIIGVLVLAFLAATAYAATVTECGVLNESDTYTLANNINSSGDCLTLNGSITLDRGNSIFSNGTGTTRAITNLDATAISRPWLSPLDSTTASLYSFNNSANNALSNGTLSTQNETITAYDLTTGKAIMRFNGHFHLGNVDMTTLIVNTTASKTVVDFASSTGISSTHTLFVPVTDSTGVYVCPKATTLATLVATCANMSKFSYADAFAETTRTVGGYSITVNITNSQYVISGLAGTGVAEGLVTNLTIWDSTETDGHLLSGMTKYENEQVQFFANFTNASNMPANSSNGACKIDYENPSYDGYEAMNFNTTYNIFIANTSFASAATYNWKVNCTGQGDNIATTDTVLITSSIPTSANAPEFGTWMMMLLALSLVAGGIARVRRRAN